MKERPASMFFGIAFLLGIGNLAGSGWLLVALIGLTYLNMRLDILVKVIKNEIEPEKPQEEIVVDTSKT